MGLFLVLTLFPARSLAQACALNIPSGSFTLSNGSFSYCSLSVSAGATLFIGGSVTVQVTGNVDIQGSVEGVGQG
jgi:hypothetical protein